MYVTGTENIYHLFLFSSNVGITSDIDIGILH